MIFPTLFANQFREIEKKPTATRSNKILIPIHSTIAQIAAEHTDYDVISLPDQEYKFESDLGSKKVDIAIGRFVCSSEKQAKILVDKSINYLENKSVGGKENDNQRWI